MRGKHVRVRSELRTDNVDYVHSVQYNSQKLRFIIPLPLYDTDNTITSLTQHKQQAHKEQNDQDRFALIHLS
jgi:hypothetical protein